MKVLGHEIKIITDDLIYIEDRDEGKTITNSVNEIVVELIKKIGVHGRKIYYKDTSKKIDQIIIRDKKFFAFKTGTGDPNVKIIKENLGNVKKN